jgi:nucleolin
VYVQGLPFTATEQDIRTFFKDVGDIASIRLPKWHDSGKLKGYGHVEFKKAESATKALDLNGEYLQDRYLSIDRPMVPRALANAEAHEPSAKPAGCRTIFIKNLPYETTEAEITESFMVFGPIKSVRLAVWNHTGKLKGIGYVDFKREDSAETAVKKSGTVSVQGRKILVDYETSAPKGSFKSKPGSLAPATAKK